MLEFLVLTGCQRCSVPQRVHNMEGVANALNSSHVFSGQRASLKDDEAVLICYGIKPLQHSWVLMLAQQHMDVVYPAPPCMSLLSLMRTHTDAILRNSAHRSIIHCPLQVEPARDAKVLIGRRC